jgi:hypothetical protein
MQTAKFDKKEPILLEVPSAYKGLDQEKIAFDHSKAAFGLFTILKTVGRRYLLSFACLSSCLG